jgi:RNAse (barnase) inhibitor barstar
MALSDIFGFKVKDKTDGSQIPSVVPPNKNDGSLIIDTSVVGGGWTGYAYDIDQNAKTENEQIRRYRDIANYPEVDSAIVDIVNECIVSDQTDYPVKLELDNLKISNGLKEKFQDAFIEILDKLDFNLEGHDIFRQWYVDGKVYFHILFKNNDVKQGIAELRMVDPMKIKKIRNIKKKNNGRGVEIVDSIEEYFIYNDKGISETALQGIKLTVDSVVMSHSGSVDSNGLVVGFLNKAIKASNQLKMLEDAIVIHTITRAPDKRIFYIDVGNLPKIKAEQYVTDVMNKFKNKLVYNASTGEIADSKKHMSMIEDFWMPRRDGSKGTEITTLQGSQSLITAEFVTYFQNKLYQSLNVPLGRMRPDTGFSLGRSSEVSREELKFGKFVSRLRLRFSSLFHDLLRIQLIAKGLIRADEWEDIRSKIRYDFIRDNHFTELKDAELLTNRIQILGQVDPFLGKYYSKKWIQKKVLLLADDEIDEMEKEIKKEGEDAVPTEISNQVTMMKIQQDMQPEQPEDDGSGDQQIQQSQEVHDQKLRQSEELHAQNLKGKK